MVSSHLLQSPERLLTVPAPRNASSKPAFCEKLMRKNSRMMLETATSVKPSTTAIMMCALWSVSVTTAKGG